eukprot:TRINITY_DN136748_c0_g1_i1.p2 TRINITY_DN136748_c0_g1~~TRINITY_DN136748_c0_g1_i1.p2  ORF type:complete len:86 (+),score=13.63 TRINITY_DN136748_c0_g1_i1:366-623(+)
MPIVHISLKKGTQEIIEDLVVVYLGDRKSNRDVKLLPEDFNPRWEETFAQVENLYTYHTTILGNLMKELDIDKINDIRQNVARLF